METATVILEGDRQTVRLPKSIDLPKEVFVRQEGEPVVLEPAKPRRGRQVFLIPFTSQIPHLNVRNKVNFRRQNYCRQP